MPQLALNILEFRNEIADNFIKNDCNIEAYSYITNFPDFWQSNSLILVGEEKSGRTLLANIWKKRAGAVFVTKENINDILQSEITQNTIFENIETIEKQDEENLFHLFNKVKNAGFYLLLTSKKPIFGLNFSLPDLKSRLDNCDITNINSITPDFQKILFQKKFLELQLQVNEKVLDYILPRIERSYKAVCELSEKLNKKSIETKRNITIPFVKEMLFEQK
jgi:chromosomal replication initiation ATPase DnaA